MVTVGRGTEGAAVAARIRQDSLRRLRLASVLAPTALALVIVGPALVGMEGIPLSRQLGQPLFAGVGAAAALGAVYLADTCDDLQTIAEQNLRLLMLLMSLASVAIGGAWLWLGTMNLVNWMLGGA